MRLFISSPRIGLEEIRDAILKNEDKLDVSLGAMELFLSSPKSPKEECLEQLRLSDCVILIVGPQYGSIDPESQKSFTELEFDEAKRLGIDVFPFVLASSVNTWQADDSDPATKLKHETFFRKIQSIGGTIAPFSSGADIIDKISVAIDQHKDRLSKPYKPLVGYKDYFSVFIRNQNSEQLFRHDYKFFGRENEINKIDNFLKSNKRILVISGRGGIGKSKLIYEAAKKYEDDENAGGRFLFIKENVNFNDSVLKEIPSGKSILVIEDAHRYEQLLNVLSIFRNRDLFERIKLIITTRPTGLDTVNMNLNISLDNVYVEDTLIMEDLNSKDTEKLIQQFISDVTIIEQIKRITLDCPLAAIIGSRLIAEKKVNPSFIANSEEFNRRVLDRLMEDYKQTLSKEDFLDDLLKYIAAIGPVRSDDKSLIKILGHILKTKESKIQIELGKLETSGFLVRRGRLLRITPDLLNDHILYNACLSQNGEQTTFPMEVYYEFSQEYVPNLLVNISEIDWRAKADKKNVNLLQEVWNDIYQKFKDATFYQRFNILGQIEKASIFQPKQTLDIVKIARSENTASHPVGELQEILLRWTHQNVLRELPKILKQISYHFEYLEECCQILWELGRDDERQLNPFPDHAIRVLQDIAGYHNPRQSILYKEQIVNFLEKLSAKPDVHEHKYSIFEIIHQILGKEGTYTTSNAATITYHPYALNASALLPLRARAISILEKGFTGESPAVVNRAFFCLLHALSYSHGSFGRPISQEEENQWLPEQFSILEIITKILKSSHSKVLDLLVQKNMHWLKKHAHHDEIKLKVCEIFSLIIVDYDFRIYRALQGDIFDLLVEEGDFDKQREAISQELEQLALEIIETEKTPSGIFQKLDDILETLEDYRCAPQPKDLLYKIALNNTELAINLFKLVVQNPEKSIAKYSSAFLYPLSHHEKFDSVVEAGIATGNKDIILNIIYAYAWGIFSNSIVRPSSINHLRKIMDLKDITYIPTLLNAISNLGRIQPSTAKDLLLEIKIDEKHANIFCHCINDQFGIPMSEFTKKDIQQILDTLVPLNIFGSDRYHIENFLKKAGHNYPELIITFLIDRLKESHRTDVKISEYIPLPYLGFDLVLFDPAIIQDLDRFVIQVLDLVLSYEGNDNFWFPKIFETVSNGYSNKAIQAMRKWLRPLNERKILSVALVLREAPENFLFDQYEFIGDLLQCAKEISGDCLKQVESNIFNISFSGSWTRSFGEPSQKHSNLKENALKITQNFSAIHPAHGFYLDIVKSAEREIEEGRARDEELEYE